MLLAASGGFWALFAWRLRSAEEPFIPLSILQNAIARNASLCSAFGWALHRPLRRHAGLFRGALASPRSFGVALIP